MSPLCFPCPPLVPPHDSNSKNYRVNKAQPLLKPQGKQKMYSRQMCSSRDTESMTSAKEVQPGQSLILLLLIYILEGAQIAPTCSKQIFLCGCSKKDHNSDASTLFSKDEDSAYRLAAQHTWQTKSFEKDILKTKSFSFSGLNKHKVLGSSLALLSPSKYKRGPYHQRLCQSLQPELNSPDRSKKTTVTQESYKHTCTFRIVSDLSENSICSSPLAQHS